MASNRTRKARAHSLIEVLVVVAMIALLLSILLPSLRQAKDRTRELACAANLSMIGKALSGYTLTGRDWVPGSMWTTGRWWLDNYDRRTAWEPALGREIDQEICPPFSPFAVEWHDFATPLRRQMYGAKIAPYPGIDAAAATRLRYKLIDETLQDEFLCPANREVAFGWYKGNIIEGAPHVPATSYLAMWQMMKAGPRYYDNPPAGWSSPNELTSIATSEYTYDNNVIPPDNYLPQLDRIGRRLSMKVFIADGVRFFDPDWNWDDGPVPIDAEAGSFTYNLHPADLKGTFAASPPATRNWDQGSRAQGREYTTARRFSYRHGRNNRINALFFDGHVEPMDVDVSRKRSDGGGFRGKAVAPRYYWPSGSVVRSPQELHDETIPAGTILP